MFLFISEILKSEHSLMFFALLNYVACACYICKSDDGGRGEALPFLLIMPSVAYHFLLSSPFDLKYTLMQISIIRLLS